MNAPTIHGAEHDLAVVREVRDRILAGDWTQGAIRDDAGRRCLVGHLVIDGTGMTFFVVSEVMHAQYHVVSEGHWNDTHTQAEVVALLDDVEDSLLGELGVLS